MKPDKILLINTIPSSLKGVKKTANFPINILSIGTWIMKKSNFKVRIIDCLVEDNYEEIIKNELSKKDILLIGISVMSSCVPNALEITRLIKKFSPETKIIWGGIHCRLYPEQTIQHHLIDFVCCGEGEKPLLNLAKCLYSGKPYKDIKGILYKEKEKIIKTPEDDFIDLNEIGMMNYSLLNPQVFNKKRAILLTSRGCPHRCTFCINVAIKNRRWRFLTAENVVKEVEYLIRNYGVKIIVFNDESFFVNRDRTEKILDMLLKKKLFLKYAGAARADYFSKGLITPDMLKKMKKLGFYDIGIGYEFGSQKMLDFIKKDITTKDQLTAAKMLAESDIGATFSFMTAFPNETKKDTLETIRLIRKISLMNPGITFVEDNGKIIQWDDKARVNGPQLYRPYPGGELYNYLVEKYKWNTPKKLEDWEKYFQENTRYKIEDYPWIKNPNFYAALQFYIKNGKSNFSIFISRLKMPYPLKLKILLILFYPFARIRMLLNRFEFPFEYVIGNKLGFIKNFEI